MDNLPSTPRIRPTRAPPKRTRPLRRHLTMLAVAIGAAGLFACEEEEWSQGIVTGKIDFDDPAWPLPQIPETATAGVPLEIAIWTGGNGCYEYARTAGGVNGRSATVRPVDLFTVGLGCSTDPEFVEHRTTRVFEEAGTAEITLWYSDGGAITREDHSGDRSTVYTVEVSPAG